MAHSSGPLPALGLRARAVMVAREKSPRSQACVDHSLFLSFVTKAREGRSTAVMSAPPTPFAPPGTGEAKGLTSCLAGLVPLVHVRRELRSAEEHDLGKPGHVFVLEV